MRQTLKNNITSQYLTELELLELYDKKYNLTENDINKYIIAYDHINGSLGFDKYKLTEGITNNKNKYIKILVDLFHQSIHSKIIISFPISVVFGIKQVGQDIKNLTRWEIHNLCSVYGVNDDDTINYWYEENKIFK